MASAARGVLHPRAALGAFSGGARLGSEPGGAVKAACEGVRAVRDELHVVVGEVHGAVGACDRCANFLASSTKRTISHVLEELEPRFQQHSMGLRYAVTADTSALLTVP